MRSFAADSFALLTTPDELSEDHLKSSADASEVQTFNKPRRGNTSREHLFSAPVFDFSKRGKNKEDEGAFAFAPASRYVHRHGDCLGKGCPTLPILQ